MVPSRRWRQGLILVGAAVCCTGALRVASAWLAPGAPVVIVAPPIVPPAQVRVELPPPPPPLPPPPAAPPIDPEPPAADPQPAPVIGTSCVVDTSTIGLPLGEGIDGARNLLAVRASRHGCTIAALTQDRLYVSWDGGQTFANYPMTGSVNAAATSGRVAIVRDGRELGVVRPGDTEITWRALTGVAERDGSPSAATGIAAAGAWTVVAAAKLILATDDDGRTWRYLTVPADGVQLGDLEIDGRLTTTVVAPVRPPTEADMMSGPVPVETRRFETRILAGRWRKLPALPGTLVAATAAWSYVQDLDNFWGCGSNDKLIAIRGGRQFEFAGALRDDVYHVSIAANANVAFAGYNTKLHRVVGWRSEEVADMPAEDPRVVAIDGDGFPLAIGSSGLLRWSPRGGWRRLLAAP